MADALGQRAAEDLVNEALKATKQLYYCYSALLVVSELYKQMNMY